MGLLDEITDEQALIKELENQIAQAKLGMQRTDLMMQGGPTGAPDGGNFTPPTGDALADMLAMQAQMQQGMQ